jgi:hypothetical protein
MKTRLEKVYDKLATNKTSLKSQKIELSSIQEIEDLYEAQYQSLSEASYLAYEWGDEIIDAFDEFRMKYNLDDYIINGTTTDLKDHTEELKEKVEDFESKANELGIDPGELINGFDEIKSSVQFGLDTHEDAKDKYREVVSYTGMPDFWKNA